MLNKLNPAPRSHQKSMQKPKTSTHTSIISQVVKKVNRFCLFFAIFASISSIIIGSTPVNATTGPKTTYSPSTYSSANSFYFKDFTADYFLWRDENGTSRLTVFEELTAVFPSSNQNHGITRVIPFTNNDGKNLTMNTGDTIYIDVLRNGEEEPVSKVEVGDGYYNVYIGDADEYVHGEQVYDLTYEFENVMLDEDGWQELYWDANGNDWSQRFDQVTARVHLSDNIADAFAGDALCFVGKYGSTGSSRCSIEEYTEDVEVFDGMRSSKYIEFTAKRLTSRETLTFDLKFDPGTFAPAPTNYDYRYMIAAIGITIGTIIMIIFMILAVKSVAKKRKYYKELFIKPEYTPAKDFTVAEMADNYIGKSVKGDSKVATLLELAVNHKIEMIKTEKDGAFKRKKTEWTIRIKTDTLNKQQATILKILAGSDTPLRNGQEIIVKSHTATPELTKLVAKFSETVKKSLETKGLSEPTDKKSKNGKKPINFSNLLSVVTAIWVFLWIAVFVFLFEDTPSYVTVFGENYLPIYIILVALIVTVVSFMVSIKTAKYASHTEKGLEYSRYMEGLEMYMKMAEADRIKMLQSVKGADTTHQGVVKIYEKLLPYAVIFKLEKSWLDELGKYYEFDDVAAPTWYVGVGIFNAHAFSAAIMSMNSAASSTIIHSGTSSSSSGISGFSGGGFAGGGGGGGGGGGW